MKTRAFALVFGVFFALVTTGCGDDDSSVDPYCGDGVIDVGEGCDDGVDNSDTAPDACRTDCFDASCGDGVLDTGEECDDGNTTNGDGCASDCVLSSCGDGVLDAGEDCDDGAANSDTDPDACRTDCVDASCGDGVADTGEECDDGAGNSDTAVDACRTDCFDAACGDDVVDTGEECDDGNTISGDGCSSICVLSTCGDGVLDANQGEVCDDGPLNEDVPNADCRTDCQPRRCGDGILDDLSPSSEVCDLASLGGADCAGQGLGGGNLACLGDCTGFDVTNCWVTNDGVCDITNGEDHTNSPGDCAWSGVLAAGPGGACAVKNDDTVWCWGNTPTQVTGFTGAPTKICVGMNHKCSIVGGVVYCWGDNTHGQLGDGTNTTSPTPVAVSGITGASDIACATNYSCAIAGGIVRCWGNNTYGQLGNGTTNSSNVPQTVSGISGPLRIATGELFAHTCVVTAGVQTYCWGDNQFGQLGDGTTTQRLLPRLVTLPAGEIGWRAEAGALHTCIGTLSNNVYCWGFNSSGQVGIGNNTSPQLSPVLTTGPLMDELSLGGNHSHGMISSTGAVYAWGQNADGQHGNGSTTDSFNPVLIAGLNVISIAAGIDFTCGVTTAGAAVQCWGGSNLGSGGGTSTTPVTVTDPY